MWDGGDGNHAARLARLCSELSVDRPTADDDGGGAPRLVYRGPTTQIYRRGDEGRKVSAPARVERERRVAPSLPASCARRRLRDVTPIASEGAGPRASYRFPWVPGVDLAAWIAARAAPRPSQAAGGRDADLRTRLGVATALARALGDLHDAGIAHGKLEPANAIVEGPGRGGHVAVGLIDLAAAVTLAGGAGDAKARGADLAALGRAFGRLFGVEDDDLGDRPGEREPPRPDSDEDSCGDAKRSKRGKSSRALEGPPLYLAAMIAALLRSGGTDGGGRGGGEASYAGGGVASVLADLRAAAAKFDTYLGRGLDREKEASLLNRLPIPSAAFYGRRSEVGVLRSALHSVCGTGKPAMAGEWKCAGLVAVEGRT